MSIQVNNVSLVRNSQRLLDNTNLVLEAREVVAIVGPNGAGKTSFIRLQSGELVPSSGEVLLDGENIARISLERRAQSIAVLPQHSLLDFPFAVREVILMGRIPHYTGAIKDAEIAAEVIDALDLLPLSDRIYTTLSGGERQRVQIARVLCQIWDRLATAHLLLDEPTAPLDLAHQLRALNLARELAASGAAVLLVMHDINLAARFADRMVIMSNGCVIAAGLPEEVVTQPNLLAAFGVEVDVTKAPDGVPLVYTRGAIAR